MNQQQDLDGKANQWKWFRYSYSESGIVPAELTILFTEYNNLKLV